MCRDQRSMLVGWRVYFVSSLSLFAVLQYAFFRNELISYPAAEMFKGWKLSTFMNYPRNPNSGTVEVAKQSSFTFSFLSNFSRLYTYI